jgi:hypothetical protein
VQEPLTVEFRLGGVLQMTLSLGAVEGTEVTTAAGGVAELVVDGRVVSTASSDNTLCDSPIGLFSQCAVAAGAYWFVGNGSATSVQVRLALNGVEVGVVTLQPGEEQPFTTADDGTMEAFVGTQLVARAESSSDPCVRIVPVCTDPTDGEVWGLEPLRSVVVTVEIGGVAAGTFDLTVGGRQFSSTLSGTAQVFISGILVDEAEPATGPCVTIFAVCSDSAIGSVFAVSNLRDRPARAEVRMNGAALGVFDLEAFGFVEVASPTSGTAALYLDGLLVMEAESSDEQCLNVDIFSSCFDPAARGYQWNLQNQRAMALVVELCLDGTPAGTVILDPFGGQVVSNSRPGTMQVYLNGVFMSEAESSSEPCFEPSPTVAPAQLPGTGGARGAPLVLGLACLVAGLLVVAMTRRRDNRTPVRS